MEKIRLYQNPNLDTKKIYEGDEYKRGTFLPFADSTDHFWWNCLKCKGHVDIIDVDFYSNDNTIYFDLLCKYCKSLGVRKIYLDNEKNGDNFFTISMDLLLKKKDSTLNKTIEEIYNNRNFVKENLGPT